MSRVCLLIVVRLGLALVPVPATTAHEIGLCINMAAARAVSSPPTGPRDHSLAALDATHCMFIDPCSQQTRGGVAAPINTWWHVSQEGLELPGLATDGIKHTNEHSLEYARVPQGVLLEVCQPDFSWFRQHGLWRCNQDVAAHVSISGACPSTGPHTLFDCIQTTQFDAQATLLPKLSYPTASPWGNVFGVCETPSNPPSGMTLSLCKALKEGHDLYWYTAAPLGTSQLVRYSLQDSWGCHAQADMLASQFTGPDTPNQVEECPPAVGKVFAKTSVACSFTCDIDHSLTGNVCVPICGPAFTRVCAPNQRGDQACNSNRMYRCVMCTYAGGVELIPWWPQNPHLCRTKPCPIGTFGEDGVCIPCAPNTFAASPGSAQCAPCGHGTFALAGSAACETCFSDGAAPACDAGLQAFASVAAIDAYFALHPNDKYGIASRNRMYEFCHARGVCLPCQPGHYEQGGECIGCRLGEYQPHFRKTQCFACAYGQNTSRISAETESECVCQPGFE